MVSVALFLWMVYGWLVDSLAMIVANVLTLGVIVLILTGVVRLRQREVHDQG